MQPQKIDPLVVAYSIAIVIAVAIVVLAVPVGFYTVFFLRLSETYTYSAQVTSLPLYIGLITLSLPLTPSVGVIFAVLTSLITVFLALAAYQGGGIARALKDAPRQGMRALFRNPLTATIIILGAALMATVILDYLQTSAGVSTGGLAPEDPLDFLTSFTLAPFVEEFGFRMTLIGLPLLLFLLLTGASLRQSLRSLWRPSAAWEVAAGSEPPTMRERALKQSYRLLVYFLIAVSSLMFGVAHYTSGAGWGPGKISEAALDGVALAYLYMRYGFHTAVLFHWATDFASNAYAFFAQAEYGIPWTSNSAYSLLPEYAIVFLVGIPGLVYILYRMVMWLLRWRRVAPAVGTPAPEVYPVA